MGGGVGCKHPWPLVGEDGRPFSEISGIFYLVILMYCRGRKIKININNKIIIKFIINNK